MHLRQDGRVTQRFPIRFTGANRAMALLGMRPRSSYVDVEPDVLRVRMGSTFDVEVPRETVRRAAADHQRAWGWGVHGWRGEWLVNGSSSGLVRIELSAPARGRLLGVSVRITALRVAVEDPDGLIAALTS